MQIASLRNGESFMNKRLTFIAEIGMNHNGNFGLFFELIKQAAYAGADFAKFQLGWRADEGEINQLTKAELEEISRCCDYFSIQPLFSIFTHEALQISLDFDFKAFKIASRTVIEDTVLAKRIISMGKPTFISLGMTEKHSPFGNPENVHYLWCKSKYPALPWNLNGFPKDFSGSIYDGLSDHSVGIEIPLLAIARGSLIIEKHFTLDKSDTTIRDHALSATPEEFRQMVLLGRNLKRNLDIGL